MCPIAGVNNARLAPVEIEAVLEPINENGSVPVGMNGEIYNHRELRRELQRCRPFWRFPFGNSPTRTGRAA